MFICSVSNEPLGGSLVTLQSSPGEQVALIRIIVPDYNRLNGPFGEQVSLSRVYRRCYRSNSSWLYSEESATIINEDGHLKAIEATPS